ncbi:MAG: DUF192 domain-containing protein [Proteobacteria bacterium]|nr:MAG: DUF192 domain-containing protein [Pseudomonadota bacterium]
MMKMILAATLLFSGYACQSAAAPEAKKTSEAKPAKLKTEKITVDGKIVVAEIADTDPSREHGLMNRTKMGENEGMLFVFDQDEMLGFWMKNTLIPLAIGYFDSELKLIEVHEMVPAPMGDMYPKSYPSSKPARYALEMNKGWYTRHNVKPGAKLVRARPLPGK